MSTSADADSPAPLVVVSWYAKHGQGSRLSFLDLAARRYRHVLLVAPHLRDDGTAGVKPLKVHAGGIVWHGPYLHIAATSRGFFTCRVDDLLRVPDAGLVETFGHRYVLPVRFAYRAYADDGLERLRYSFLSLDQDADPPQLVVGEYGGRKQTRRLARFAVDPATKFLAEQERVSRPLALEEDGVVRAQGAAIAAGRFYVTSSHGPWTPGSVHVGRPGSFRHAPLGHADGARGHRLGARRRPALVGHRAPAAAVGVLDEAELVRPPRRRSEGVTHRSHSLSGVRTPDKQCER